MDRWTIFIVSQFVSAVLGFYLGMITNNLLFIYIGGFFFAVGAFAVTRWGYDKFFRYGKGKGKGRYNKERKR